MQHFYLISQLVLIVLNIFLFIFKATSKHKVMIEILYRKCNCCALFFRNLRKQQSSPICQTQTLAKFISLISSISDESYLLNSSFSAFPFDCITSLNANYFFSFFFHSFELFRFCFWLGTYLNIVFLLMLFIFYSFIFTVYLSSCLFVCLFEVFDLQIIFLPLFFSVRFFIYDCAFWFFVISTFCYDLPFTLVCLFVQFSVDLSYPLVCLELYLLTFLIVCLLMKPFL